MTDAVRAIAAYAIAGAVIVGGFTFLAFRGDDANTVIVAGFMGSALTFVFGSEVQTRTARQAAASTLAAAVNGKGGTMIPPDSERDQAQPAK